MKITDLPEFLRDEDQRLAVARLLEWTGNEDDGEAEGETDISTQLYRAMMRRAARDVRSFRPDR